MLVHAFSCGHSHNLVLVPPNNSLGLCFVSATRIMSMSSCGMRISWRSILFKASCSHHCCLSTQYTSPCCHHGSSPVLCSESAQCNLTCGPTNHVAQAHLSTNHCLRNSTAPSVKPCMRLLSRLQSRYSLWSSAADHGEPVLASKARCHRDACPLVFAVWSTCTISNARTYGHKTMLQRFLPSKLINIIMQPADTSSLRHAVAPELQLPFFGGESQHFSAVPWPRRPECHEHTG